MARSNPPFMSGIPEMFVLKLLSNDEMYGYEIVNSIRALTDGDIALGEGVVYPALHALERAGRLRSRKKKISGRERIYYRTTAKGIGRLEQLRDKWSRLATNVELVMATNAS